MLTKNEIRLIKSLCDKKSRSEHGLFVIEGRKSVEEVCMSGIQVKEVFVTSDTPTEGQRHILPQEMERITALKTPTEILAVAEIPQYKPLKSSSIKGLILALDNVQDPGNMGTIIRIADWFGITDIVCSTDSADCYNPKVVQATMGAITRVRIHYTDLVRFIEEASEDRIPVYGTFLEGDNIYSAELTDTGIVVMGNEGKGISDRIAATVSHKLFIPPFPVDKQGSESLNVAVATAVVCSEFRRRGV